MTVWRDRSALYWSFRRELRLFPERLINTLNIYNDKKSADKASKPLHVISLLRQSNSYTVELSQNKGESVLFQPFLKPKSWAPKVFSSIGLELGSHVYICNLSYVIVLASNHKARERRLLHDADWFVGVVLDINRYIMTSLVENKQQCADKSTIM